MNKAGSSSIAGAHPFGTSQGGTGQCGGSLPSSSIPVEALKPGSPAPSQSTTKPASHSASLSQVAGSVDSADAVQAFGNHAYVSPIKLRRMTRNAPDLETKIKLQ
jgi:uncharacterized secreted protein with C-terminal beta-propeller domain